MLPSPNEKKDESSLFARVCYFIVGALLGLVVAAKYLSGPMVMTDVVGMSFLGGVIGIVLGNKIFEMWKY